MVNKEIAAILSLRVYEDDVRQFNLPLIPAGWEKLPNPIVGTNGFAYGIFRNIDTQEVVIAYCGTDGLSGMLGWDGLTNLALYFGATTAQSTQAAQVYETRVSQILMNLVGNAAKFTVKGVVTIVANWTPTGSGEGRLRMTVKDTGVGFSSGDKERFFSKFGRGSDSTRSGSGLGLSICKDLVEAMGGSIDAQSTLGAGSEFWFELPCRCDPLPETV